MVVADYSPVKSDGSLSAAGIRSYRPPPAPVDPTYDRDGSPVRMVVRQGWWRLFRAQHSKRHSAPAMICAELVTDIDDVLMPGAPTLGRAAVSARCMIPEELEEMIGFAIPVPAMDALQRSAPRLVPATSASRIKILPQKLAQITRTAALRHDYLPWRASRVDIVGQPATSYGRLRHAEPALRSWAGGGIQLDVGSVSAVQDQFGVPVREVAYRILRDGRVIVSSRATLDDHVDPLSDRAIRALINRPKPEDLRTGPSPSGRLDYYGWIQDQLRLLVAETQEPFRRGTRVRIDPRLEVDSPYGTVLERTDSRNRVAIDSTEYSVRPDMSDLPGHHWQHHPRAGVRIPGWALRPTLISPDPGLPASSGPLPLAFGARIRSIDDPLVDEATVLRTHLRPGGFVYEVRPDGPSGRDGLTFFIDAIDATPMRGTAWKTLEYLEAARAAGGISRVPGEILVTISTRRIIGSPGYTNPDAWKITERYGGPVFDVSASPFPDTASDLDL